MLLFSENAVTEEQELSKKKMIVFGMDNTLLKGNFILTCADKFVFDQELVRLKKTIKDPLVLLKAIAKLFSGLTKEQLLLLIAQMELADGAREMIKQLRQHGYITGIITNSYQFAADYLKQLLNLDFAIGNRLEFESGVATGAVTVPAYFFYHQVQLCNHGFCKTNALIYAAQNYGVPWHNTIAVGATEKNHCIISEAGYGIAYRPRNPGLGLAADEVIDTLSFDSLPALAHLL
ncbi:MAG: haloacid dehalogenase-like hydrolase [Bacteroidetes bacterium]|nr:haloacid dehalogenase-like hydrolase [Bacteroidota bacterium]